MENLELKNLVDFFEKYDPETSNRYKGKVINETECPKPKFDFCRCFRHNSIVVHGNGNNID